MVLSAVHQLAFNCAAFRCRSEDVQQLVGAPPATMAGPSPAGSGESGASLPSAEPQAPAASARQAGRALAATLFRDCNALQQELGIAAIPGSNTALRNALALQLWLRVHLLAACKGKRDACSGCRQLVLFPFGLLLPRAFADMHGDRNCCRPLQMCSRDRHCCMPFQICSRDRHCCMLHVMAHSRLGSWHET